MLRCSILLGFLQLIQGRLYSVDITKPWLSSESQLLSFQEGGAGFLLMGNGFIRVNARGVHVLTQAQLMPWVVQGQYGWDAYTCNISAWGMCDYGPGLVFPVSTASGKPQFSYGNPQGLHCADNTGRFMVGNDTYDISACDIVDEGLDVIYTGQTVYWKYTKINWLVYWILVGASIWIVRAVSINIMTKMNSQEHPSQLALLVCVSITFITVLVQGDSYYTTETDNFFYWINMLYIFLYWCFHLYYYVFHRLDPHFIEPRVFNLGTACLQAVAMRLYCTAETPYTPVLLVMLLIRIWEKDYRKLLMFVCTGMFDCLYVSLLIYVGYAIEDALYLIPLIALSKLLSGYVVKWG